MTEVTYELQDATAKIGEVVVSKVTRTRARTYPGLVAVAPQTRVLYELAKEHLSAAQVIWDIGAGSGSGCAVLAELQARVIAIDPDPTARAFASSFAPDVTVVANGDGQPAPDAATIIDVLGHVASPFALLRDLRKVMRPADRVFVAEPLAYPNQTIVAPARRAFCRSGLEALANAAGFRVDLWVARTGAFLVCTLVAVADEGSVALENAAIALTAGNVEAARDSYAIAATSVEFGVQREATLAMADLHYALHEGDLACAAYLRAHEIDHTDPRALAGLAQLIAETGDLVSAAKFAQQALAIEPADASAQVAMAVVLDRAAPDNALEFWRRAASLAPDQCELVSRYAMLALASGDAASAWLALERARWFGEDEAPTLNIALTHVLIALKRTEDARNEALIAKAKAPQNPEVLALFTAIDLAVAGG